MLFPSVGASAAPQSPPALPPAAAQVCGMEVPAPTRSPPANAPPIVLALVLCFEKQGGHSVIDPQTYLYYIKTKPSEPSRDQWVAYEDDVKDTLVADFRRLWGTAFLDDLSIEVHDARLENGVIGKIVVFDLEERLRVKIVDYEGVTHVERSKIDETLKERGIDIRLDSFLDSGSLRRVASAVRDTYLQKGFRFVEVTPAVTPLDAGAKLVHVTFKVTEGPRTAIRNVQFLGNGHLDDATLEKALKANRPQGLRSWVSRSGGTFDENEWAEEAQNIVDSYRERGYITARVGQPDLRVLDDSEDGATRYVQMRVPVIEGEQYDLGTLTFDGNTVLPADALRRVFNLKSGAPYDEGRIRKGLEKLREIYGAGGYFEFTAYPDLRPRTQANGTEADETAEPSTRVLGPAGRPIVDATLRMSEGKQYFVNRISFAGNTTTNDEVIRRELMLVEAGVFNTEYLKHSIKRLNQLGYFKPIEQKGISVEKTDGADNKVDVRLKVEEQNRNQVTFGVGTSQYEGFFGNASFTTANFLGRGESVTVSLQKGTRSTNYTLGFTEPYLFGRAISAGTNLYSRKVDYRLYSATVDYSEVRSGAGTTIGLPLRRYLRLFGTYNYEIIDTATSKSLAEALRTGTTGVAALYFTQGRYIQSSVTSTVVYNTVDSPFAPRQGQRVTASYEFAGGLLGGTSHFSKPEVEGMLYVPLSRRTALGLRANAGWILNRTSKELPYYLRYFLGGETTIRGVDIRSVGPMNASQVALGGSKFVLFNAEAYYDILPQVRAVAFHDAGQAFGEKQPMDLRQLRTSTGFEVRVTLPVINAPFRLIYAWNFYRDTFQPARGFRFAVGTTF